MRRAALAAMCLLVSGSAAAVPVDLRLASTGSGVKVAWAFADPCEIVEVHTLTGRLVRRLGRASHDGCPLGVRDAAGQYVDISDGWAGPVAVRGNTALVGFVVSSNPGVGVGLVRLEPGRTLALAGYFAATGWSNQYLRFAGLGSDASSLVWGWWDEAARIHEDSGGGCLPSCRFRVAAGGIERWAGGGVTHVPHSPPAALLASGDGYIAVDTFSQRFWSRARPRPDRLELLRSQDGSVVTSVRHPRDELSSIAVSRRWLVEISRRRGSFGAPDLVVRRLPDGGVMRRLRLPNAGFAAPPVIGGSALSLRDGLLVLNDGNAAWSLRLPSGTLERITSRRVHDAVALGPGQLAWSECDTDHCTIHVKSVP